MINFIHVDGENKAQIKLFALSTCVWCKKTRRLLDKLGVEYDYVYVDLVDDKDAYEVKKEFVKWNPDTSFPTIVINNEYCIIGFDEEKINRELSK